MPDYRRNRVAGGSYLFTVSLPDRNSRLPTDQVFVLREAVRTDRAQAPSRIDA
jgi:putative transposase